MRAVDVGIGVPLGLVFFYGLSLASAFWIAVVPGYYVWGVLLSAVICGVMGLVFAVRASIALGAAGTMLIVVVVGIATGSETYLSVPPFPGALLPLLFHGSRSAVVIGPLVLVGTAATIQVISQARARRKEHIERM